MKKLLLFIGLIFLFSCEKEELFCWECEETTSYKLDYGVPDPIVQVFAKTSTICDKSVSDIRTYEEDQYFFLTIKTDSRTYATKEVTLKCEKQ